MVLDFGGITISVSVGIPVLDTISAKLDQLIQQGEDMAIDFSKIQAAVTDNTAAINKAMALMDQITAELATISSQTSDPATQAQIDALTAQITTATSSLQADVAKDTPASPPATT